MKLRNETTQMSRSKDQQSVLENMKYSKEATISNHLDNDIDYTSSHKQNKWVYKEPQGPMIQDDAIVNRSILGDKIHFDDYIKLRQLKTQEELNELKR
jgi:hypothetical protein